MATTLRRLSRTGPLLVILASLFTCGLSAAGPALAAWSVGGNGNAAGAATVMPAGNTPSVAVTGSNVTVQWAAATLPGGIAVAGYIVQRYNALNGQLATIGPSCAGIVTSTSCTETGVPAGSWVYTDTPVLANWSGPQSSPSPPATVNPLAPSAARVGFLAGHKGGGGAGGGI